MRPNTKFQSIFTDFTKEVPGPGSYEAAKASQNLNGFTVNARFKSPLAAKISPSGTRFDLTFIKKAAKEPGPGEYSPTTAGNNMYGTFFHSKNGNTGAPVFSKSKRQVVLDNSETRKITPGPGTYRFQSDFGYYNAHDAELSMLSMTMNSFSGNKAKTNNNSFVNSQMLTNTLTRKHEDDEDEDQ